MEGLIIKRPISKNFKYGMISAFGVFGIIILVCTIKSYMIMESLSLSKSVVDEQEFKYFILTYNKNYRCKEFEERFKIFAENIAHIRLHNSLGHDWILGVNQFSDLSPEEFKSLYLPYKFEVPEQKIFEIIENVDDDYPLSIDWRQSGAVSEVKNQGTCGSCWSFSASGAIEGAWQIAGNQLVSLSEQHLISCSFSYGNNGCNGGLMSDAFNYVINSGGLASEQVYPYVSVNGKLPECDRTLSSQVSAKITSQGQVKPNNPESLLSAISKQPISVALEADQSIWQHYAGGVITSNCGTNLDHGVLVVGYNTEDTTPYYIVKNSWGPEWGLGGYVHIGISKGAGICGIQMMPVYPIV